MANIVQRYSPGPVINEKNASPAITSFANTYTYVIGYATKGEAYFPVKIRSIQEFTNYFGIPQNDAEKYFYNTVINILLESGIVLACRIPYDNVMEDNYKYYGGDVLLPIMEIYADDTRPFVYVYEPISWTIPVSVWEYEPISWTIPVSVWEYSEISWDITP